MEMKNVILLVIDTLRYDYAMRDPYLKELSEKGMSFERMYSPSTFTNANMSSIRSGMYPPRHGWRSWPGTYPLGDNIKTIEDFLDESGYSYNAIEMPMNLGETQALIEQGGLFLWMTEQEPFFLYSQCMYIHDERFGHVYVNDSSDFATFLPPAVDFIKTAFGRVEAQGFDNDTLWIIMSDHGVGMRGDKLGGEGYDVGAGQLYDFRNRIYCVLIGSDIEPQVMTGAYSQIDLLPSILDYCDIPPTIPEGYLEMQGVSVFDEPDPDRYVYMEAQSPNSIWPSEEPNVFGATNGRHKLMMTPDGNKLYDLDADPEEKNDLLAVDTEAMIEFVEETKE